MQEERPVLGVQGWELRADGGQSGVGGNSARRGGRREERKETLAWEGGTEGGSHRGGAGGDRGLVRRGWESAAVRGLPATERRDGGEA